MRFRSFHQVSICLCSKEKKQKDEKANSEAEAGSNENTGDNTSSQDSENSDDNSSKSSDSVIPWWCLPGGGNSYTGSGDNISNNDSKPSITQIQGGKQNNRKFAIATEVLAVAVAGAALALPYLTSHQMSSLKGFIPPLSGVEYSALFIRNNGTLVHAKEGDFYVLPDIWRNHALVFNNKAANHKEYAHIEVFQNNYKKRPLQQAIKKQMLPNRKHLLFVML